MFFIPQLFQIISDIFYRAEWFYNDQISINDCVYFFFVIVLHPKSIAIGKISSIWIQHPRYSTKSVLKSVPSIDSCIAYSFCTCIANTILAQLNYLVIVNIIVIHQQLAICS